jgi:GAF domain-containing protein
MAGARWPVCGWPPAQPPDEWTARLAAATPVTGSSGPLAATARIPRDRQLVADRIAARARTVYGLSDTLAAPLTVDDRVIGAIVLSHRTPDTWSETNRRLLIGAAGEASSALSRLLASRGGGQRDDRR